MVSTLPICALTLCKLQECWRHQSKMLLISKGAPLLQICQIWMPYLITLMNNLNFCYIFVFGNSAVFRVPAIRLPLASQPIFIWTIMVLLAFQYSRKFSLKRWYQFMPSLKEKQKWFIFEEGEKPDYFSFSNAVFCYGKPMNMLHFLHQLEIQKELWSKEILSLFHTFKFPDFYLQPCNNILLLNS